MLNPAASLAPNVTPIGVVTIARTTYVVRPLPVGENAARCGILRQFALEGPKGSAAMVIDYGAGMKLTAFFLNRRSGMPRPMRDARRADFAAFGVEA